ncbi:hypothetical protein [Geomicrobium sp. JCM 19038]|uniref:hypothetical protein n=1 Tax=Geomicrobium sp. JCM 19038 TaxID=1460635 RepID=UPI00045F2699|nr:hypothetical protein [Geomicrobium sp. JCM 19038]GAK09032.1 hypothetical protein JCM19038_2843 [Geomicrobium sp. JCM 19038]
MSKRKNPFLTVLILLSSMLVAASCSSTVETSAELNEDNEVKQEFIFSHFFPSSVPMETEVVQGFISDVER